MVSFFAMAASDVLAATWYGNSRGTWLVAVGIAAATAGTLLVLRRQAIKRLSRAVNRPAAGFDGLGVDLITRTRWYFLIALSVALGAEWLDLPVRTDDRLTRVVVLTLLLQIAAWGSGIIAFWVDRFAAERRAANDTASLTAVTALGYLGRAILWLLVGVLVLENFQIRITTLVAGLGITGVAVALALQNILGDLFGALSILLDKPFVVGDAISVEGLQGTVERIGLKTTRLRALSGEELIFANADLLRSRIRNYKRQYDRRVSLTLSAVLGTPRDLLPWIPAMLKDVVARENDVRFERAHLAAITESGIQFELVYWVTTADYAVHMDRQQAILIEVLQRLDKAGVRLAAPTRALTLDRALSEAASLTPIAPAGQGGDTTPMRPDAPTSR
ncbi:MAG: mechanosensitive ion channel family protein [Gemmatimonadaceae bacterium]